MTGLLSGKWARLLVAVWVLKSLAPDADAAGPEWWEVRGVIEPERAAEDFMPVTLGQLKWIATQGAEELNSFLPGGAGTSAMALINAWSAPQPDGSRVPIITAADDDFAFANLGQVKNTAKPFYDRLIAARLLGSYPWTGRTADDHAVANLGQLKQIFRFSSDNDGDGIDDLWEIEHGGNLATFGGADAQGRPRDYDGDGWSDADEYSLGMDLRVNDAARVTKSRLAQPAI